MKKIFLGLLIIVVLFLVAFATVDDFRYEVNNWVFRTFIKQDGVYCSPVNCISVVHEYETLYNMNMEYMYEHGPNDENRPGKEYKYRYDIDAYVKFWEK